MNETIETTQIFDPYAIMWWLVAGSVLVSVVLSLTKKAVFYQNYNDMLLSLSVIAIPVMMIFLISSLASFLPDLLKIILIIIPSILIFVMVVISTYQSNNKNLILTVILVISKLTLSVLYILYLVQLMMGKNRNERGLAALILIFLTPLMIALVADRETGSNPLTRRSFRFW